MIRDEMMDGRDSDDTHDIFSSNYITIDVEDFLHFLKSESIKESVIQLLENRQPMSTLISLTLCVRT